MRTKTVLLSALLGGLGSVSVMAQTNVYSLNAVGYINVTISPGFNIVSCPLWATDPSGAIDNTLSNLLVNTNGQYKKWSVYGWNGTYETASGLGTSWGGDASQTINPGQAIWLENPTNATYTVTFVGTVPTGPITNALAPGFNLVGSAVPASGDLITNSIMDFGTNAFKKDSIYVYNPTSSNYATYSALSGGNWPTHPFIPNVAEGFWYDNATTNSTTNYWVENYSVSNP